MESGPEVQSNLNISKLLKPFMMQMVDKIPTTFDPINKFVEQKTNGMIKDLFEGDVDPLIVAILVNAVYFKGMYTYT